MKEQSLIGIVFGGLLILILLPFVLTEMELMEEKRHIHTIEEVNRLGGVKPVYVEFCHEEQMLVDQLGRYYYTERVEEILERYEDN